MYIYVYTYIICIYTYIYIYIYTSICRCTMYTHRPPATSQACKRCDKIHVQYELMMTATGRTVSAAVQIVPYGAVVAKVPPPRDVWDWAIKHRPRSAKQLGKDQGWGINHPKWGFNHSNPTGFPFGIFMGWFFVGFFVQPTMIKSWIIDTSPYWGMVIPKNRQWWTYYSLTTISPTPCDMPCFDHGTVKCIQDISYLC